VVDFHLFFNYKFFWVLLYQEKMKQKVAIFGIIVQLAGLIYGVINKAEDIIVMCLIFMFISTLALYDKSENTKS
tara:strand:+ start:418 stop:639 length:222 start_codon:yes stop_codon:yes gene_type:complete